VAAWPGVKEYNPVMVAYSSAMATETQSCINSLNEKFVGQPTPRLQEVNAVIAIADRTTKKREFEEERFMES